MKRGLSAGVWRVVVVCLGLVLFSGYAKAQTCDQCAACKKSNIPGVPDDCTERAACLLRCTANTVVDDLDTLRRNALDRLSRDENDGARRIEGELNSQLATVRTKATDGRTALEGALADSAAQARVRVAADANQVLARQEEAMEPIRDIGSQLQAAGACFREALPNPVQQAYGDVTQWGQRQEDAAGAARNSALAAVDAGWNDAKAQAGPLFAAPVDQLASFGSPLQNLHDAASRIKNSIQSLSDLDALRRDAQNGFQELRDSADHGVSQVDAAAGTAASSIQTLVQNSGERVRLAQQQWLSRASAALASVQFGDPERDVSSLADLRNKLRNATSSWKEVLSCLCANMDIVPPTDPSDEKGIGDAVCIPPLREAPIDVALEAYLSARTVGGVFDFRGFSQAAAHVRSMPKAALHTKVLETAPGTISQALTADPAWEFVGPRNLNVPFNEDHSPAPEAGRVNAVAYDPRNPGTLFAGSAAGGLWRSTDSGANWQPLSDAVKLPGGGLQPGWPDTHVSSIAISPADSNVIYAGLGDYPAGLFSPAFGIMRTTDGGANWVRLGAFGSVPVTHILIDPEDPNVVIATTGSQGGTNAQVWRSADAGNTWTAVVATLGTWTGAAMGVLDPTIGNRAYYVAGIVPNAGSPTGQILISTDRGVTWTLLTSPVSSKDVAVDLAASPTVPGNIYALFPQNHQIFRSTNRGANWTDISAGFPNGNGNENWNQVGYDDYIGCGSHNGGDVLFVGLVDLAVSPDGGSTWKSLGGPTYRKHAHTHSDQHGFALHPSDQNKFLLGNDGGVYEITLSFSAIRPRSAPSVSATVNSLNRNLGITMFYAAAFHPSDPNIMIGGAQDNASPVSTGDLQNWLNRGSGDGAGVAISPQRPNTQYVTTYSSCLIGSGNGPGQAPLPCNIQPKGKLVAKLPPQQAKQTVNVFKTTSGWVIHRGPFAGTPTVEEWIPSFVGNDRVPFTPTVTADIGNSTFLYTATQFLYRLDDRFPLNPWRWKRLSGTALSTTSVVKRIAVAPSDRKTIYTAAGDGEVWASFDRGSSWKRLNGGPAAVGPCSPAAGGGVSCPSANALSVNPSDPNDLLVGFSRRSVVGGSPRTVFRVTATNTPSPVWTDVSGAGATALPNVVVNAVERDIDSPATTFFAGTDLGVSMTTDGGATWSDAGVAFGLPQVEVRDLVAVPATRFLHAATFGRGIWRLKF